MSTRVNVDNFREAETARMFDNILAITGGVNRWFHYRLPTPVERQPVIRMNRDTLYSGAVVDLGAGARLTLPEAGGRYLSVMAVNGEHYINRVYRGAGAHDLTASEHGTPYVLLAARTFVDPEDPGDVARVNALQDGLLLEAGSARPFEHADFDEVGLDATRDGLAALGRGLSDRARTFGSRSEVEATRHLIGTATAWGGLPESEAYYFIDSEPRAAGRFTMTLRDVPVDAFWSVTIYNRDGYLEANPFGTFSKNSVTAKAEPDGSVVLSLAPDGAGLANHLYVMDGWNYGLRLYRPRPEVLDGTWTPPTPVPAA
jgi:hypothetical protein